MKALGHFKWHFRAFLETVGIHVTLLLLLIIAEVLLLYWDFGAGVMLPYTAVKIVDDWDRDLLCAIPAILCLVSHILIVLLILNLICQVIIIVRDDSTVLLAIAIALIQFISAAASLSLLLLRRRYLTLPWVVTVNRFMWSLSAHLRLISTWQVQIARRSLILGLSTHSITRFPMWLTTGLRANSLWL